MIEKQNNLVFDEIESIEDIGMKQTYDFRIPETHNYIANGVNVHNSGSIEQDADVILLLWRDGPEDPLLNIRMAKSRQVEPGEDVKLTWLKERRRYADYAKEL